MQSLLGLLAARKCLRSVFPALLQPAKRLTCSHYTPAQLPPLSRARTAPSPATADRLVPAVSFLFLPLTPLHASPAHVLTFRMHSSLPLLRDKPAEQSHPARLRHAWHLLLPVTKPKRAPTLLPNPSLGPLGSAPHVCGTDVEDPHCSITLPLATILAPTYKNPQSPTSNPRALGNFSLQSPPLIREEEERKGEDHHRCRCCARKRRSTRRH